MAMLKLTDSHQWPKHVFINHQYILMVPLPHTRTFLNCYRCAMSWIDCVKRCCILHMLTQYVTTNTSFSPSFFLLQLFQTVHSKPSSVRRQDEGRVQCRLGRQRRCEARGRDFCVRSNAYILYVKLFHNNSENNEDLEDIILEIMDLWHVRTACWYIHGTAGVPRAGCLLLQRARGYIHIFWRERNFNKISLLIGNVVTFRQVRHASH